MVQPGYERLLRLALPATVALLGIVLSITAYSRVHAEETLASSQDLSEVGQELARAAGDIQLIASEQVLAIQGLFESRSVTVGQFERFTSVIGTPFDSRLAYAPMVTSGELDRFLDQTRLTQPGFNLYGADQEPRAVYWPLLYSSEVDDAGYRPGFDFGSDPAIRAAIEGAMLAGRPVASRFVGVPGDDQPSDLVIVSVIRRNSFPVGIAVATLRLDELLEPRVRQLLGDTASLHLRDAADPAEAANQDGSTHWVESVNFAGQEITLVLEVAGEPMVRGSASRWLLLLGIATSVLIGLLVYDRSRRRAMIDQLGNLQQTLAEKDRFLASISHELRTPLTAVVGTLELLRNMSLDADVRDMLFEDARVSAAELERLVEDHLTAARLTAGALTVRTDVVDLDALLARILTSTERPARLSIKVGELGNCTGDAIRIRQIVRNLIRNADRFAVSEIEVRAVRTSALTIVEILNDGDPVPANFVDKLFEPFVKGSNPGQPDTLGLGLFVSRDLARRMGGALSYSYDGDRVMFSLSLPGARPAMVPPPAPVVPSEDLVA